MKNIIVFFVILHLASTACAQSFNYASERPVEKGLLTRSILPIALIASGIVLSDSAIEKSFQKDVTELMPSDFYTTIDDYTRYAPIVILYGADALGVPAKHHWFNQTKNMVFSALLAGATTAVLKNSIDKKRPDGSNLLNSFPSGHTTMAFVTATTVYEEFIDEQPALAYSGYIFAIGTGGLRILNHKHWLSDVAVGAGIGILMTKLAYTFDHLWAWNPFQPKSDTVIIPQYQKDTLGFYFSNFF